MATTERQSKRPTHRVYHVRGEGEKAIWKEVGAAWAHEDGEGLNVNFEYLPVASDGRLVIRKPKPRDDSATAQTEKE
ncbi:MAG: hypothetical protein ABL901_10180 [Hyphomicrobiaceae bacterium]